MFKFAVIRIVCTRPYLLFLLIPFILLTILPYFRMAKRYRKTRNRITSMVLHGITSLLVICILAGMTFERTLPNSRNEIILAVDVSNTEEQVSDQRDELVQTIINQCKFDNFKIGIVTFGYDATYAVKLTRDYTNIYSQYKAATLPDTSATNYVNALTYAKDLFTESDSKKIVLITDGKETDENVKTVIRQVVASGIYVDTAYIPSSYEGNDAQIMNVTLPDYHISTGDECSISFDVNSNYEDDYTVKLYDNGVCDESAEINLICSGGITSSSINHTFTSEGLHEITISLSDASDAVDQNNVYTTYLYLENFNKILILEQKTGQSDELKDILTEDNKYVVEVKNVLTEKLPTKVEDLCNYDEVIMNNVANSDLPEGFVDILYDYVYNYGGGLFTTGGTDESGESHAYNRDDLVGTKYQQMLPVQAINYTPPVGVMVIIDRSGSMSTKDDYGNSLLDYAKAGAVSCLNALTERDYFGVMTLDSDYSTILELTPRTQEAEILSAIESIGDATGSTVFPGAIDRAGQALRALKNVDKKHIIIVTDGQVPTSEIEAYEAYAKNYYETDGITISVIGVSMTVPGNAAQLMDDSYPVENIGTGTPFERMLRLCKITGGTLHPTSKSESSQIVSDMREDLMAPEIKEVNYETFFPTVTDVTSNLFNGVTILKDEEHSNTLSSTLDGFYGVKVRQAATTLINGDYNVPIYSQWKYGQGMVGSFMCDLYGEWSSDFMANEKQLIYNIIDSLTPTENIRINDIKLVLNEDNYTNTLSIYTTLDVGEKITGQIIKDGRIVSLDTVLEKTDTAYDSSIFTITALSLDNNYTRCKFVLKDAGAYTIEIKRVKEDGTITGQNTIYKAVAYSEEYDTTIDNDDEKYANLLKSLSLSGNGSFIADLEDPHEIIDSFKTTIVKTFDPRILFAVIAIICFLADIAIRKFKFKWPHEIVQEWSKKRR